MKLFLSVQKMFDIVDIPTLFQYALSINIMGNAFFFY